MWPYESLWELMRAYGSSWELMRAYESLWELMRANERLWELMRAYESLWELLRAYVSLWEVMRAHESLWELMRGYASSWELMRAYESLCELMRAYESSWELMRGYASLWSPMMSLVLWFFKNLRELRAVRCVVISLWLDHWFLMSDKSNSLYLLSSPLLTDVVITIIIADLSCGAFVSMAAYCIVFELPLNYSMATEPLFRVHMARSILQRTLHGYKNFRVSAQWFNT